MKIRLSQPTLVVCGNCVNTVIKSLVSGLSKDSTPSKHLPRMREALAELEAAAQLPEKTVLVTVDTWLECARAVKACDVLLQGNHFDDFSYSWKLEIGQALDELTAARYQLPALSKGGRQ